MTRDPVTANVPEGTRLVMHDEHTITIQDKWPKSTFHLLVLPRIPFPIQKGKDEGKDQDRGKDKESPPQLSLARGKLLSGTSSGNTVPASHVQDLSTLLASPYASQILAALRAASERAVQWVHEQMLELPLPGSGQQKCKTTWTVERAFHAIPSMQTVHLHVYSHDLVSPALKNAKHYNSFRPGHGFALPLSEIEALVEQGKKALPEPSSFYAELLKAPLLGRDGQRYRNIPQLKVHLEEYWRAELTAQTTNKKKRESAALADEGGDAGATEAGSSNSVGRETKKRRTSQSSTSNDT
ncbi:unnamed protein product [Tilletia caries]|nr:unnamed protein product [Tilletia caries]CAD6916922.1 unnamed protein product [Tilletia controversa]